MYSFNSIIIKTSPTQSNTILCFSRTQSYEIFIYERLVLYNLKLRGLPKAEIYKIKWNQFRKKWITFWMQFVLRNQNKTFTQKVYRICEDEYIVNSAIENIFHIGTLLISYIRLKRTKSKRIYSDANLYRSIIIIILRTHEYKMAYT